ncbi:ABC transporter ATP-binding protein [Cohnella soli]|uniref:ABC transporter ATP-binding protein n=1 Tax=Cohnella soli TaxID=425005 RepID=A0ABW0HKZ6_9BACL
MQSYLSIQGVTKTFGAFTALNRVSLDIRKNEFVCLLGPSGCGKTTLLRIVAGLEQPTSGAILVNGKDITKLPPAKRNFGMVFQSYALFPNLTARQNIAYGLKGKGYSRSEIREKTEAAIAQVDLAHVADRYPSHLSGGQQQRVALARAVVLEPDFLLLDEPLSALDAKVRNRLRRELRELQESLGITTIMVTHDQEEALTMSDRIVVMNRAEIMQIGTPTEVYEKPNSPFVADFVGAINFLHDRDPEACLAVRPENVTISSPGEGWPAVIQDIEFRGAFYRLTLKTENGAGESQMITVDVSAQMSHQLQLAKNANVSLALPRENMLSFAKGAVV